MIHERVLILHYPPLIWIITARYLDPTIKKNIYIYIYIIEGSLEVKLPTVWTDESRAGQRQRQEKS